MQNSVKYIFIFITLLQTYFVSGQTVPLPAEVQTKPIALVGGNLHTGTGQVIENALLMFSNGKIDFVGSKDGLHPDLSNYQIISATDKEIYPGLILANSSLGLIEISAIKATRDYKEIREINPHLSTLRSYNTDSHVIPTARSNGILLAQIAPSGSLIAGSSSVVQLDAWNWEDAKVTEDNGLHIYWPTEYVQKRGRHPFSGNVSFVRNEKADEKIALIRDLLNDAKTYYEHPGISRKNLRLEAMTGLFDGSKTLFVHTSHSKDVLRSVKLFKKAGVVKIVIIGANELVAVKDFIKENDIQVIIMGTHNVPQNSHHDYDLSYKLPAILTKEGIQVGLTTSAGFHVTSRNLAFHAGTAAAYGLSKEEALRMITGNMAEILGIDKWYGSLEKDKSATIIISNGDILDMKSNDVSMAFIDGRQIDLSDKNKELYNRFKTKYDRKK